MAWSPLTGKVENNQSRRTSATRVAKKVKGVKKVINNLTIDDRKSGK